MNISNILRSLLFKLGVIPAQAGIQGFGFRRNWIPAFAGMMSVVVLALAIPVLAENGVIKFATLAPEGSTWMKVMREWDKELQERTGGKLRFKIYPGGVSGDEKDVVRKIRLGQLHAGGFTGVGLGEIASEVRLLDGPFLFRSYEEIDFIHQKFDKEWRLAFERKGFIFLGWTEVGFIYFFTKQPLESIDGLKKIRMWMWEGDPIAEATFKAFGIRAIPLSIADVLSSLQTGLIDGVYTSPLAALALQWFTRTKYMYNYSLANASGAVLLSKNFFDPLSSDLKEALLSTSKKYLEQINNLSRQENSKSIEVLKKNGVAISRSPSSENIVEYETAGKRARAALAGRLYSLELLKNVEQALADYRKR